MKYLHAHPMLTPLLPLKQPDEADKLYDTDVAAAYRLIWENTLGHLRSPSEAKEGLACYQVGGAAVGVRWLAPTDRRVIPLVPELDALRKPHSSLPLGAWQEIGSGAFEIESVEAIRLPAAGAATDAAALVEWLASLEVVSPGRLSEILGELESAGWIETDGTQYHLTNRGEEQLRRLDENSDYRVTGVRTARWKEVVGSYASGTQGLDELLHATNRIFGTAIDIDTTTLQQAVPEGHTADEAYALRYKAAVHASTRSKFPAAMDPERHLPEDDTLRAKREQLEATLSSGRAHQWLCLSESEKAAIRLGAILVHFADETARARHLLSVRFDARDRWVAGLDANDSPPSAESALRAYHAWVEAGSQT